MAYPEKVLADDEQVVSHLHPHWITLVPATFFFVVICAAGGIGIALLPTSSTEHLAGLIAILAVGVVLLCWLSFAPWVRRQTTHYTFTTHRVLIRRGVFTHTGRDIPLQRISDVGFTQTLWDRMVGAGSLSIESAGEQGQEILHNIPHSDTIQQKLNRLIEQDSERRARLAHGGPPQGYPGPATPGQLGYGQPPGYGQPGQYPPSGYSPR